MFNARSLRNKFDDLRALNQTSQYDIIAVTESWLNLKTKEFESEYKIPGYTLFHNDRVIGIGGGVILYVKSSLCPLVKNFEFPDPVNGVFVEISDKFKNKLLISLFYRPPKQTREVDEALSDLIDDISCNYNTIILGDFNLPCTSWGGELSSNSGNILYQRLLTSPLHQMINVPTRDPNILDLVLTTDSDSVRDINVDDFFPNSDHRLVEFKINFSLNKEVESANYIQDFAKANWDELSCQFKSHNWSSLYSDKDPNESYKTFLRIYNNYCSEKIPQKRKQKASNVKPRWMNKEVQKSLTERKWAYKKFKRTNKIEDENAFKSKRRETKKLMEQSKKNLEQSVADQVKINPKFFFSYVNSKKTASPSVGPLKNENNEIINNTSEMADILNKFFVSVFTEEDQREIPTPDSIFNNNKDPLVSGRITREEVLTALDSMNKNSSPGPDGVHPHVLDKIKKDIVAPLTDIFNKTLETGIVPSDWKIANITPIFKKGDHSVPGNYRPISLTSVIGKLFEKILRDKIVNHLETNKLLRDSQHGFRNKRSCLTNLLDFFSEIFQTYDETRSVDVIYFDFQKAFDKVPHKRLIAKIKAHGISGNVLKWIENWLNNRKQRVVINGSPSNYMPVTSGVPQGSVLGPILFLIYINDIDIGLMSKISKFADDTKIGGAAKTAEERAQLQEDVNKLIEWADKWQMKFNVDKCSTLHIGKNNEKHSYEMDGTIIPNVDKEKDLGVIISNDLKSSKQCMEAVKKANRMLGFIGRTFKYNKSKECILTLYNALVRPHLEYCVQFWSPHLDCDIKILEQVQRRMTKLIPKCRNMRYENSLAELNLFSLSKRRIRGDMIELFKIIHGFDNLDKLQYISFALDSGTRGHNLKLEGKNFRADETKFFFFNRTVRIWNSLPSEAVNAISINSFKNKLDKWMHDNPNLDLFYSR
ncbi:MAG: hypothetical protein F6K21_30935 [Symploca sp. SIO2D2]|nr:hypothetical protein [Symploca sp. SIO2D2]